MAKPVTNPRIAKLIELETAGRIKPEHQIELDTYRAQGIAPEKPKSSKPSGEEAKAGGFYLRASRANQEYGKLGVGPESLGRAAAKAVLPPALINSNTDSARQVADAYQRDFVAATLRYESGADLPAAELESQRATYFPQPGDSPEAIKAKEKLRATAIEALKVVGGDALPPNVTAPTASTNINDVADKSPALAAAPRTVSTDGSGSSDPNRNLEMRREIAALLQGGAPADEIKAYAASKGVADLPGLDAALAFRAAHPNYKGGYLVENEADKKANVTGTLAASPVGSFIAGGVDGALLGGLDETIGGIQALTGGDYEDARDAANAKKRLLADANPKSSFAGTLAGGVAALAAPQALAARYGIPALNVLAPRAAFSPAGVATDALYGTVSGALSDNENRTRGALTGGAFAVGGGVAGRGIANAVGALAAPTGGVLSPAYEQGALPTLGQRMAGRGWVGDALNTGEQALQSVPVLGSAVARARQLPRDQWERGAFDLALNEIDDALPTAVPLGTKAHAYTQEAFDNAYDRTRGNMSFVADQDYTSEVGAWRQELRNGILSGDQADRVEKIVDSRLDGRMAGGMLDGQRYKIVASELGASARKLSATEPNMAEAISSYQTIFDNAARRASGEEAAAALDAVDRGYAKLVRIEEASRIRGKDQVTGRFNPTQFDRAVQKAEGSVRSRAYLRGDALMGDYAEAGKPLVDTLPNSGSAERLLTGQVVGGGALSGAAMLAGAATIAKGAPLFLPYTPGVNALAVRAIAPRNALSFPRVRNALESAAPAVGVLGGVGAASYYGR